MTIELRNSPPIETVTDDTVVVGAPNAGAPSAGIALASAIFTYIVSKIDVSDVSGAQSAADVATAITAAIDDLKGGVGTALDTLDELAAALGDDANFAATMTAALAGKLSLTGGTLAGLLDIAYANESRVRLNETATNTYGAMRCVGGAVRIEAGSVGAGWVGSGGTIKLCGIGENNIGYLQVKYGGAYHNILHAGNTANYTTGLSEKTPLAGTEELLINDGGTAKKATANALAALAATGPLLESSEQSIVLGGTLTIPHGLGAIPKQIWAQLVCKTAEDGWAVGDKMTWPPMILNSYSGYAHSWVAWADATNIYIRFGTGPDIAAYHRTTGAFTYLLVANFKAIFLAR